MDKEVLRIFKQKVKTFTYKALRIRRALDFSIATLEVRRCWKNAFTIPRKNYFKPKFLFPVTLSINRRVR